MHTIQDKFGIVNCSITMDDHEMPRVAAGCKYVPGSPPHARCAKVPTKPIGYFEWMSRSGHVYHAQVDKDMSHLTEQQIFELLTGQPDYNIVLRDMALNAKERKTCLGLLNEFLSGFWLKRRGF